MHYDTFRRQPIRGWFWIPKEMTNWRCMWMPVWELRRVPDDEVDPAYWLSMETLLYSLKAVYKNQWLWVALTLSLSDALRNIAWVRNVLNKMGINQNCAPNHQDNTGAIEWVETGPAKHTSKKKHVDIKHNYVMGMVGTRTVNLVRKKTSEMEANFPMKVLAALAFEMELRRTEFFRNAQPLSN